MSLSSVKLKREIVKILSNFTLKSVNVDYLGMPLKVPIVHGVVERGHMTPGEFWMGDCLKAFIDSRPGAVIDIGVNVGAYLVKLRVHSKDRQYIGFEPNPSCLLYTQELIRLNTFENCSVIPLALFDESSVTRFYSSKPGDKTGSLMKDFKPDQGREYSFDVLTMVGDEVVGRLDLREICAIKVDVEDAELHVLRGLEGTIERFRPYLYCEVLNPEGDPKNQEKSAAVHAFNRSMDYCVLGRDREANELLVIEDLGEVSTAFMDEFIFCPQECLESFRESIRSNSTDTKVSI